MFSKTNSISFLVAALFILFCNVNGFSQVSARNDTTSCNGNTVLYAIPGGGVWTTTGGAYIASPSSQSTTVSNLDAGANEFIYAVEGKGNDAVVVTNNQQFANAGNDITFSCQTDAVLNGNSIPTGGSGKWELKYLSSGVVIENSNSNITNVNNLPFGNTIFQWTIAANGCTAVDEISVNSSKPENNDGTDKSGCTNIFYLSTDIPPMGGSGFWSVVSSPGSISIDNSSLTGVEITAPIGNSVIRWTITYSTCVSTKDFNITNNLPNPNAGGDQNICIDTVTLGATAPSIAEHGVWTILNYQGEVFTNKSVFNPTVSNIKQGTSTFQWTLSNNLCTASDYVQIVNNRPDVYAGPDYTICESEFTLAANSAIPFSGIWTCSNPDAIFDNSLYNHAHVSNLVNGNNNFTWTVSNGFCSASDNVVIHSDFVSITAGIDKTDCADTLILNATPVPPGGSGNWTVTFGNGIFDNSLSNQTIVRNVSETNHYKWTILSGNCTFADELEFVNNLPSQAIAQSDKSVCSNQTLITANSPIANKESGIWTIASGSGNVVVENPSLYQTQVSKLDQGLNTFRWTIFNQYCSTTDFISITNNSITTNAGADLNICGSSFNLNAINSIGTGYWSSINPGIVFSNSTSPTSNVSNLSFGPNTLKWTSNYLDCNTSDEITLTNNLPQNVYAGSDQVVCSNSAHLAAENPSFGIGSWSVVSGSGSFSNANLYQSDVSGMATGPNTFRWTVNYQSCSVHDDVLILNNEILISAGSNQVICNQTTLPLTATSPNSGQNGVWSIIGGSGSFSNPTLYNSNLTSISKGINTYKWTISDLYCTNSSQLIITNNTPDQALVGADEIICKDNTSINAIAVSIGTGSWSVLNGGGSISNVNLNNTTVNSIPKGLNTYRWTVNNNSCSLSDDIIITNNSVSAIVPENTYHICDPSHSINLSAVNSNDPGVGGYWTKLSINSGIIESPSSYSTHISNLGNGETRFRWTVSNSICTAYDETIVIDDYYNTGAGPVGSSNLCTNYVAVLGNPPPASGQGLWTSDSPVVTFINASNAGTIVQNLPLGSVNIYWTITNNNCQAHSVFSLNNYSISTNAGKDTAYCESTLILQAKELEGSQIGYWTANYANIVFDNSAQPNTTARNIPAGSSILTWTITSNGCIASDYLIVNNNSFSVTAGIDRTICNANYSLSGSNPLTNGTGIWTLQEGTGIISNISNYNTAVSGLSSGNNVFRWTVKRNGCYEYDDVYITNDLYVAQASAPSNVCVDEVSVTALPFPAVSGVSYSWTTLHGGGVFGNPSAYSTTVIGLSQGLNRFRWTVNKGSCQSYMNIEVENNRPTVFAGVDQIVCVNFSSLFASSLSATGNGLWASDNPSINFSSPSSSFTDVSNLARGENHFTWSVNDKGCTGISSVIINNSDFDAFAGNDQLTTVESSTMSAQLPGAGATGQWNVLNGKGIFSDNASPVADLSSYGFGVNTYRWTVKWNECLSYDDVNLTYDVAEAYAGDDIVTCNSSANMNADQPFYGSGIWSLISGTGDFQNPASYNTLVTNISRGINIYRWTVDAFGVFASDDISITNNSFTTYAGTDQETCANDVNMDAMDAGIGATGYWSIIQGVGFFAENSNSKSNVSNLLAGNNIFSWEVSKNGCKAVDTVVINHYQTPTVSNAGADKTICNRDNYILEGNFPVYGNGLWSSDNPSITFFNNSLPSSQVNSLQYGPNTLRWVIKTEHCESNDEVVITTRKFVQITDQPVSQQLGEKDFVIFLVGATMDAETYQWQKNGVNLENDSRISGANQAQLKITDLMISDAGNYKCVITGFCNTINSSVATLSVISGFEDLIRSGIKIYPNPAKDFVYIDFEKPLKMSNLSLINLIGETVLFKQNLNKTEKIDLTMLADGIYFISIQIENEMVVSKLILQK